MDYRITDESKAEAVRIFERKFALTPEYMTSAFSAALDALLVPVQEEGWVVCSDESLYGGIRYIKGEYQLVDYTSPPDMGWNLYPKNITSRNDEARIAINRNNPSPSQAQAWADRIIAEREAKPFGPGTRLRAANGDELLIVYSSQGPYYYAINTAQANFQTMRNGKIGFELDDLHTALLESGAVVIEEGE